MAWDRNVSQVLEPVEIVITPGKAVVFDLSKVEAIDARFIGSAVVARRFLARSNRTPDVGSAKPRGQFDLNCFGDLLGEGKRSDV